MKVKVISSWTNPINGVILPNGTELEIDNKFFNSDYLEEIVDNKKVKTNIKNK